MAPSLYLFLYRKDLDSSVVAATDRDATFGPHSQMFRVKMNRWQKEEEEAPLKVAPLKVEI